MNSKTRTKRFAVLEQHKGQWFFTRSCEGKGNLTDQPVSIYNMDAMSISAKMHPTSFSFFLSSYGDHVRSCQ